MVVNINPEVPATPVSELNTVDHTLVIDEFLPRYVRLVGFRARTYGEDELITV